MDQQVVLFRKAVEQDEAEIRTLVRGERMNPTGLDWPNFLVAAVGERIVGTVQIRKHADGSRELGSLVVTKERRGQGIASRLIDTLLASDREPIWMITDEMHAGNYRHWGFTRIEPCTAPRKIRVNWRIGRFARIWSFIKGLPMRRLVILERLPLDRRKALRTR